MSSASRSAHSLNRRSSIRAASWYRNCSMSRSRSSRSSVVWLIAVTTGLTSPDSADFVAGHSAQLFPYLAEEHPVLGPYHFWLVGVLQVAGEHPAPILGVLDDFNDGAVAQLELRPGGHIAHKYAARRI